MSHHFTREQLEKLAEGQGGSHTTSHDAPRHTTSYDAPPAPRDIPREIYDFVYSSDHPVSRADICRALGVKKASWVTTHIEALCDQGYLVRIDGIAPNGFLPMYHYTVPR